jgi:hypothetical protein
MYGDSVAHEHWPDDRAAKGRDLARGAWDHIISLTVSSI